jgi:putative transcriptional regulator
MNSASSLAPAMLLSMPQMQDPNFSRTVVLLCRHDDDGAFGLVVNRPLVTSGRVVVNLDPPVATDRELQLWAGGPVDPHSSWILVGRRASEAEGFAAEQPGGATEGMPVTEDLYISTNAALLRRLLEPEPPSFARLIVGYSGWAPGQLEQELEASAWLMSDVDSDVIFKTAPDKMWEAAIRRIGADPATLQMSRGVH